MLQAVEPIAVHHDISYMPQNSIIFSLSLVSNDDNVPIAVMACCSGEEIKVDLYAGHFDLALYEVERRLDAYQEAHPAITMVEVCSDEVMEVMNLMLEIVRLQPVNENDFTFSEVLFRIGSPVLARQMGYGLV